MIRPVMASPRDLLRLPRSFYVRPTLVVARQLVGKFLVRIDGPDTYIGRIVETEAYQGSRDPASHAYRGRTKRNDVMFRRGGHLYVYFTYGKHFCCNVVSREEGIGHAVLIRAVEPRCGLETMARNRQSPPGSTIGLCNGPAKICQAFGIGREDNGADLCGDAVWIGRQRGRGRTVKVCRSPRIGISTARSFPWRFFEAGNPHVSRSRPATTKKPGGLDSSASSPYDSPSILS